MRIDKSLTEQAKGGQLAKRRLAWDIAYLRDHTGAFNSWEKGEFEQIITKFRGGIKDNNNWLQSKFHWLFIWYFLSKHCYLTGLIP